MFVLFQWFISFYIHKVYLDLFDIFLLFTKLITISFLFVIFYNVLHFKKLNSQIHKIKSFLDYIFNHHFYNDFNFDLIDRI